MTEIAKSRGVASDIIFIINPSVILKCKIDHILMEEIIKCDRQYSLHPLIF